MYHTKQILIRHRTTTERGSSHIRLGVRPGVQTLNPATELLEAAPPLLDFVRPRRDTDNASTVVDTGEHLAMESSNHAAARRRHVQQLGRVRSEDLRDVRVLEGLLEHLERGDQYHDNAIEFDRLARGGGVGRRQLGGPRWDDLARCAHLGGHDG